MLNKLLTFIGSGIAIFLLGELISLVDISSPKTKDFFYWKLLVSCCVACIYVVTEYALRRSKHKRFSSVILDIFLVSLIGSFAVLFGILFVLMGFGYMSFAGILREFIPSLFLGLLLCLSNFAFVLPLRAIAYAIQKNAADNKIK